MSVEFCKTYSQLVNLASDAPADTFCSSDDYNQLGSLGPTLPKLVHTFPKAGSCSVLGSAVNIQLKSIRPPHKFSTRLETVSASQSVYKVKDLLISRVEALGVAGVTPSDLKFMIRSKVITDTTSIASLVHEGTDLVITVMVSARASRPSTSQRTSETSHSAEDDPADSVPLSLSADTWTKINDVLVADVGPENGAILLQKFQSVV